MSKNGTFGGVPTREIVEKLMLLNAAEGASIDYKTLEDIIGEKWNTPRFKTCTNVWRRRLEQAGLRSIAQGGQFYFLTADERLTHNDKGFRKVARGTRRLSKRVHNDDPRKFSSDERRSIYVNQMRHASALVSAVNSATREIAMPSPVSGQASFRQKPDEGSPAAG